MYFSFPEQKEKYQKKVLFVPNMIQSLNQYSAARVLARRVAPLLKVIFFWRQKKVHLKTFLKNFLCGDDYEKNSGTRLNGFNRNASIGRSAKFAGRI